MITLRQIEWIAGFLEGEGSFMHASGAIRIYAAQVQKEPLERLQRILGGKIKLTTYRKNPIWYWYIHGKPAAGAMMTLYSMLSPRRQSQVKDSLGKWRSGLGSGWRKYLTHCIRGHEFSIENTYHLNKQRFCRKCVRIRRERREIKQS